MSQPPSQHHEPLDTFSDVQSGTGGGQEQQYEDELEYSGIDGDIPPNASNNAFISSFLTPMRPEMIRSLLGHPGSPLPVFTQSMRDLQARGKDPYVFLSDSPSYTPFAESAD
ncbi:hypothetical protein SEPCBS57363_004457 [Sporothrix epigloea]|uniref:Uncharacterized protein n=1 Tax=Sporothrix epigloea TaxID=1892477 RepID=A0ABP0DTB4_9PEZI